MAAKVALLPLLKSLPSVSDGGQITLLEGLPKAWHEEEGRQDREQLRQEGVEEEVISSALQPLS
jgi:hypothetical protein